MTLRVPRILRSNGLRIDREARANSGWGRASKGQTSTEYMLVISAIVIALAAASYSINPTLQKSFEKLLGGGTDSSASQQNIPSQVERGYINANPGNR